MTRFNRRALISVIIAALFSTTVIVGVIFFAGIWRVGKSYTISAYVSNARGIAQNATVFEAGLPVGIVKSVDRKGPDAILVMRITNGPRPLPVDSEIQLGLRSLVGEVEVNLSVGSSQQKVRNGGSLGLSQDEDYTEVDQILNTLAGPNEAKARNFFQGLGNSVAGEGQNLNQTVGGFSNLVIDSLPLTSTIGKQHEQVADIVQNFGNIMSAIGQRTSALQQFATGARTTFTDLAERDVALRKGLAQLPGFTEHVSDIAHEFTVDTPKIGPVVNQLSSTLTDLQPTIRDLTPATASGVKLVDTLGSADPTLKTLMVDLRQVKAPASTALPALHSILCQANPMLRYIAPFNNDIAAFFEDFGGATDGYMGSHALFANIQVDPTHLFRGGVATPTEENALNTLLDFGVFKKAGGTFGYNAIPGPNQDDNTSIGLGDSGPTVYGLTHTYPHVTADCTS